MSNQESEVSPLDPPELPPRSLRRRPFPICPKCNQSCASKDNNDGDLVRAFNQVYHYRCFTCEVIILKGMSNSSYSSSGSSSSNHSKTKKKKRARAHNIS